MTQVIIFKKNENNGVGVIYPALNCGLSIHDIAKKDTPAGVPYFIVDEEDFPDNDFFDAWEADFTNPDGYGIGADAWFTEQEALNDNN
jgi:hypothetical protein